MADEHEKFLYPARAGFLTLLLASTLLLAVSAGKVALGGNFVALQFVSAAAGIALGGSYSMGRLAHLRLTPERIEVRDLFRKSSFTWDEFEGFRDDDEPYKLLRFIPIPRTRLILEFAPQAADDPGSWAALRFTYGLSAEELATELNFWHEHGRAPDADELAELMPEPEMDEEPEPEPEPGPEPEPEPELEDEDEEFDLSPIDESDGEDDEGAAAAAAAVAEAQAELEALKQQRADAAQQAREEAQAAREAAEAEKKKQLDKLAKDRAKESKKLAKQREKELKQRQKEQQKAAKERQKALQQRQKEQQKAREQALKDKKKPKKPAAASQRDRQQAVHKRTDSPPQGGGMNWGKWSTWLGVIIGVGLALAGAWFFLLRDIVQGDDLKRDDILQQVERNLPPGDKATADIDCPTDIELAAGSITVCDVFIDGEVAYFMEVVQKDSTGSRFEVRKIEIEDEKDKDDIATGVEEGARSGSGDGDGDTGNDDGGNG